jgi:hypothetical protein
MAPFLDPGSRVFDDPDKYGYKLRARTLEEHRERLVMPSWKHIMNYESDAMTPDEMVDATYEAGLAINRIKSEAGIVDAATAATVETRIGEARTAMRRIDAIMDGPLANRDASLAALKNEFERLSESTVCEKSELNWPASAGVSHVAAAAGLFVRENVANLFGRKNGDFSPAHSDQHPKQPVRNVPDTPEA